MLLYSVSKGDLSLVYHWNELDWPGLDEASRRSLSYIDYYSMFFSDSRVCMFHL